MVQRVWAAGGKGVMLKELSPGAWVSQAEGQARESRQVGAAPDRRTSLEKSMVLGSSSREQERNQAIYVAVMDGATFAELAEKHGISRERVKQLYHRERANAWIARSKGEASYLDRAFPADV